MNQKGVLTTYKKLLIREHNIRDKQELEELGVASDCWSVLKLELRYKKDKTVDFFEGVQVDKLWIYRHRHPSLSRDCGNMLLIEECLLQR